VQGGFLDVAERNAGVEGGSDKRVPQGMSPDRFGDPGAVGYPADDPRGAMPVQPLPIRAAEDRPVHALADGKVDRPRGGGRERDGDDLAALAGDHQGTVPPLHAQGFNAGAGGFGDPQPVERQQRDQRVLGRRAQPGGGQQRPEFVAVQPGGVRVIVRLPKSAQSSQDSLVAVELGRAGRQEAQPELAVAVVGELADDPGAVHAAVARDKEHRPGGAGG